MLGTVVAIFGLVLLMWVGGSQWMASSSEEGSMVDGPELASSSKPYPVDVPNNGASVSPERRGEPPAKPMASARWGAREFVPSGLGHTVEVEELRRLVKEAEEKYGPVGIRMPVHDTAGELNRALASLRDRRLLWSPKYSPERSKRVQTRIAVALWRKGSTQEMKDAASGAREECEAGIGGPRDVDAFAQHCLKVVQELESQ